MAKFALVLAFLSSGIGIPLAYLYSLGLPDVVPYPDRVMCIPALVLGIASWWKCKTFGRSLPVLGCLLVMLIGLFIVEATERGRGLLVFAGVATAVPISALIVETRSCRLCVKVFVGSALVTFLLLVYLQGILPTGARFGSLIIKDQQISDPNVVATQLGIAAVMTISLMQVGGAFANRSKESLQEDPRLQFLLALFCSGILFTASRSGIITFFAVLTFFAFSRYTKPAHRIGIFLAGTFAILLMVSTDNPIAQRFRDSQELSDFGNRLPIWETGMWVLKSSKDYLIHGVGTGGIDKALAEHSWHDATFRRGEDGILRRASHNAYLEWCVSHGLLGAPFGFWLILSSILRSWRLDRKDSSIDRRAMLAYCFVISIAAELYRLPFATPLCAILLAMLSGPYLAPWPKKVKKSLWSKHTSRSIGQLGYLRRSRRRKLETGVS